MLGAVIAFAASVLSVTSGLMGTEPAFVALAITYAVLVSRTYTPLFHDYKFSIFL